MIEAVWTKHGARIKILGVRCSAGYSYLVSLLSLYGTNIFGFLFLSARALMTFPRARSDLLMFLPSLCCLLEVVTVPFSDPAKSIRLNLECFQVAVVPDTLCRPLRYIWKMAWDREDSELALVLLCVRSVLPRSSMSRSSSAFLGWCMLTPRSVTFPSDPSFITSFLPEIRDVR